MSERKTLEQLTDGELHISHSQISTYQNCSLKYFFRYVEGRKAESVNISVTVGSSIHTALATLYRSIKANHTEPLEAITETFKTCLSLDIENSELPIIYSKTTPDKESAIAMGVKMLEVFYNTVNIGDYSVVDVELPLSAQLYTHEGKPTDFKLVGIIDLLLKSPSGDLLVVDFKTASKSISKTAVDEDTQLTAYSYLLASNKFITSTSDIECQYCVLLKTKEPKIQQISTIRTRSDRRRFAKIANVVLAAIDAKIFMPVQSWLCSSCDYSTICKKW
ncbi:MAG: PD-(D/E)XK nuclease family protein [Desulfamplus sp.]|nr:PD-(D/E)XK nuclease family protein [Desulfamplus sp.]